MMHNQLLQFQEHPRFHHSAYSMQAPQLEGRRDESAFQGNIRRDCTTNGSKSPENQSPETLALEHLTLCYYV
jgi:hypothetical protein